MTITFNTCTSEKHHLTRTFAGSGTDVTGVLRDQASVMDPVIQIEGTASITNYNYFEIPSFGRKYFITDTPVLVNGMWEVHGHVDVIGTWLEEIKAAPALADERENINNIYMDDGHVYMENREITQLKYFKADENSYAGDAKEGEPGYGNAYFPEDGWEYVLITMGPGEEAEEED